MWNVNVTVSFCAPTGATLVELAESDSNMLFRLSVTISAYGLVSVDVLVFWSRSVAVNVPPTAHGGLWCWCPRRN